MSRRHRVGRVRRREARARKRGPAGRSALTFHRALASARMAAGLTQADLASMAGTTQSAIARLESGDVTPTVETLRRLADLLGVRFEIAPGSGLALRRDRPGRLTLAGLRRRRDQLLRIAETHGALRVRVFGSVATGRAHGGSDVDLLVEFDPGRTVLDLSNFILDLEEALGRKVHVVEARDPTDLAERIRREAVPL